MGEGGHIRQVRMKRSPQVHLLAALGTTSDDLEVASNGSPLLVIHRPGFLIAYPGVDSSPSGVDPHDVLEPEVLP